MPSWVDEPTVTADQVAGVIITIDHFGNLITNIDADADPRASRPRWCVPAATACRCGGPTATSGPGEFLALVNSFGVIEIARAEQSAAEALGPGAGRPGDDFQPLTARLSPPAHSLVELP